MNIYILYYIIHVLLYRFSYVLSRKIFSSFVFHEAVIKIIAFIQSKKKANDEQRINIHSRALVHEKWCVHFAISIAKYSQLPDGVVSRGSGTLSQGGRVLYCFSVISTRRTKRQARVGRWRGRAVTRRRNRAGEVAAGWLCSYGQVARHRRQARETIR